MLVTEVITSYPAIEKLAGEWNDLLVSSGSDTVFLTSEWLSCWWKTLDDNAVPFVIVVREANQILAVAPLLIVEDSVLGIPVRRLQFIGSPNADYADFIVVRDRDLCLTAILRCILDHAKEWDFVELLHVTDESPNWHSLRSALDATGFSHTVSKWSVCPYVPIGDSFAAYYRSLSKKLRYDLGRQERRLQEIGELRFDVLDDQREAKVALADFAAMLTRREWDVGRVGPSSAYRRLRAQCSALLESEDAFRRIHFSKLSLSGDTIAYHFGFEYGDKLYYYKPTFDLEYAQYSPGKVLIKQLIEYAFNRGLKEFDFLLGDEHYKMRWATRTRTSYNVRLFSNSNKSRALRIWLNHIKPSLKRIPGITDAVAWLKRGEGFS